MKEDTHFAPALRSTSDEIEFENQFVSSQELFVKIFNLLGGFAALLDSNRQIIYSNQEILNLLGIDSIETILGKRPGEVISCIHSNKEPYGCGTSEACAFCGAVNAIMESQITGKKSTKETRISSVIEGKHFSWDLNVSSIPIVLGGKTFYIFTLQDISNEKRRSALERIFFHDLLNSVGGLNGLLSILKEGVDPKEEDEIIDLSEELSRDILEEIISHKQLRAAENGDLKVTIEMVNSHEFLTTTINKIRAHSVAKNKHIDSDLKPPEIHLETDRLLLQRVIINLLKNALEATPEDGTVSTGIEDLNDRIRFWVKNETIIPPDVQYQLFQRSFSTKGNNRGIGTYSIKLLTENFLKGKVTFVSNDQVRTIFSIELYKKWNE